VGFGTEFVQIWKKSKTKRKKLQKYVDYFGKNDTIELIKQGGGGDDSGAYGADQELYSEIDRCA
jgi:hypothetical protein